LVAAGGLDINRGKTYHTPVKFLISKSLSRVLVVAALMGLPFQSRAAYDMYLSFTAVTGGATTSQIAISSIQWGAGRGIGSPVGGTRTASAPSFSEVTITKLMDSSSPMLALLSANGTGTATCVLTIQDHNTGNVLYTLTLNQVYISGYSVSSGGDVPSESLSFNYTRITWVYTNPSTGKASPTLGWDLAKQAQYP
jgi:type VI secretion system secreted protein Hcp